MLAAGSNIVSATVVFDKPASAIISPALASSKGTLSRPRKAKTFVIRPSSLASPSIVSDFTIEFGLIDPDVILPVRMRPRNGSYSIVVTNILKFSSVSIVGAGTCSITRSKRLFMLLVGVAGSSAAQPFFADANNVGKSNCSSFASSTVNKSNISS